MICITDAIAVEHRVLRNVFAEVEKLLPGLERLEDIIAIARMVEALLHHHGDIEENMIYATLDHKLAEIGRLEQMSQEHGELDERLAKACAATNSKQARGDLLAAIAFSRRHFEREERNVFPMINQWLSGDSLKALGEAQYLTCNVQREA